MFAVIGILMALRSRDQTGVGQFVDVSMFDSMISAMASNFANYLGSGKVPGPLGTSFASIVPYRTFATSDRDNAIAVGSEKISADFCAVIGRLDLISHPGYATKADRVKSREAVEPCSRESSLKTQRKTGPPGCLPQACRVRRSEPSRKSTTTRKPLCA